VNTKSLDQSMALMNQTFLVEYASRNTAYLLRYGNGTINAESCWTMLDYLNDT